MRKCLVCGKGNLEKARDIVLEIEGYVFVVDGERCSCCKEEFPYEAETRKVIETARGLGVWPEPMNLYRHLSKSGGGLVFRIPADLEKQLRLDENVEIAVSKVGNKIVISPE